VLESGSPAEALRIVEDFPGSIPLMITDVVMPEFSGSVLAERVAKVRPEIKVLYASGYTDVSLFPLRVLGQDYAFIEKPFTRDDLLKRVRHLLDSSMKLPNRPAISRGSV
jgi:DNA-binding NtrC family response regulator